MTTIELDIKRMEVFREILDVEDENILTGTIAYIRKSKKAEGVRAIPPEGFMTGDEFERRVKTRVKQLYKEHGLL
jgi:hypothetical protein